MKIRRILQLSIFLGLISILMVSGTIILLHIFEVQRHSKARALDNVVRETIILRSILQEFHATQNQRAMLQGRVQFGNLTSLLENLPAYDDETRALKTRIIQECTAVSSLFNHLSSDDGALQKEVHDMIGGQLSVKTASMVSDILELDDLNDEHGYRERRWWVAVVAGSAGFLSLVIILFLLVLHRRVIAPVLQLKKATGVVGAGNLDFVIPPKYDDEIGALTRDFNGMTAELRATISRLELTNQELQEFAFVASHDLQEPLRKIQTFCDLAKRRCGPVLDSTSREYLDRVFNSADRMRQLLRDLLQFSRVALKPEPFKRVDLHEIVREAANVFEATVKDTGSRIEIGKMPSLQADESQMLRLFQNLIGNSLKFRNEQPHRILIHAEQEVEDMCEIRVKDNGIGFEPQYAELIFKPFQRLHTRGEYDGTGMGLAICRKIVERHGGNIKAESEPGKGSTFIIRLPARQLTLEDE